MNRKLIATAVLLIALLSISIRNAQAQAQTPCTPGISFWNLLDKVAIGYVDGRLTIGELVGVCLPTPAKESTSNYIYDPDVGGKLTTVVKSADGKVLNTYVWYVEKFGILSRYKVLGGYESVKPLTPGNYLLEFAANEKAFYRFPFRVVEGKNEDPYQPAGARYFIDGPWSEYGNIYYQRNDPQSPLRFTVWVQDKGSTASSANTPYDLKLINLKDGRVVAEESGRLRLKPHWQKADLSLLSGSGDKKSYTKAAELLAEDGRYEFRLGIDGKPYGIYPFEVKGGKIQFQGKQIREKTDPMTMIVDYLSGGRYSSWWIKRDP